MSETPDDDLKLTAIAVANVLRRERLFGMYQPDIGMVIVRPIRTS